MSHPETVDGTVADTSDEGTLDPLVAEWFAANPTMTQPFDDFSPEMLALARGPVGAPPTRELAQIVDDTVEGIPVRIYRGDAPPTGLVVYFHGGGFCIGSIGLMDNVAREITHHSGAVVVSVEYRLAPEHPYPAGLDDCETVTRWAFAHAREFGVPVERVAVAGESAGGNLSAAVALRLLRDAGAALAGQVLLYPGVDANSDEHESRRQFDGIILNGSSMDGYWERYSAGRDLSRDPFAAPLRAESLEGLPPALVVLGGCDLLRDEGRAYAGRLRDAGVPVDEVCYPGQPHGFLNFGLPAAAPAFEKVGAWLRQRFAKTDATS
jgi:acetyl esterase